MAIDKETEIFFHRDVNSIDHSFIFAVGSFYSPKTYDKTTLEYLKDTKRKLDALIERIKDDKENG